MREAITSKRTIAATAAITLFALAIAPAAFTNSPPQNMLLSMSGYLSTNPNNVLPGSFFSLSIASVPGTSFTRGALVQGFLAGFYFDSLGHFDYVVGGWSYNTSTQKALMKLVESDVSGTPIPGGFSINLAFLNLNPNVGFTFQGILFAGTGGPVMLTSAPPTAPTFS